MKNMKKTYIFRVGGYAGAGERARAFQPNFIGFVCSAGLLEKLSEASPMSKIDNASWL